ncbi:hypothetical protein [Ammoniphilus sp. YIM 78166]|uniref:hypothetical protein n=1 Tax=Ammoniphilus sp. YIM 78166 TaxID=1644106 RepID=UPI00106F8136|nr:hypothetical protein [Ammoniphilus sp. YIM 78166]
MIKLFFLRRKYKRLRLKVWNKRLAKQLEELTLTVPWHGKVELQVGWGPFYNGFAIISRRRQFGKIVVQLPYDYYLTSVEQSVLSRYKISQRQLPYFILFHEFFHLMDTVCMTQGTNSSELIRLSSELYKAINGSSSETAYRQLSFERQADDFAFEHLLRINQKAS